MNIYANSFEMNINSTQEGIFCERVGVDLKVSFFEARLITEGGRKKLFKRAEITDESATDLFVFLSDDVDFNVVIYLSQFVVYAQHAYFEFEIIAFFATLHIVQTQRVSEQ